jgi:two-component system, chemotaxis family, protein-glutamate methylesterase/glutaminase
MCSSIVALIESEELNLTKLKVVVLVGSAGALRAFSAVLGGLPSDLEASFVVIMHLQSGHESVLASILSRSTDMPVKQAAGEDTLEPGHVYVAPPDAHLLVADGRLELDLGPPIHFLRPSADVLLASLAREVDGRGLAVILSGSGSDGAAGVVAVKEAGGVVLAQDDEAEYAGMPHAAIASGAVDRILPLEDISSAIVEFVRPPES